MAGLRLVERNIQTITRHIPLQHRIFFFCFFIIFEFFNRGRIRVCPSETSAIFISIYHLSLLVYLLNFCLFVWNVTCLFIIIIIIIIYLFNFFIVFFILVSQKKFRQICVLFLLVFLVFVCFFFHWFLIEYVLGNTGYTGTQSFNYYRKRGRDKSMQQRLVKSLPADWIWRRTWRRKRRRKRRERAYYRNSGTTESDRKEEQLKWW